MKTLWLLVIILWVAPASLAQDTSPWSSFSWLMGTWRGTGGGKPGKGSGEFTFAVDPSSGALLRTSRSEDPASRKKPPAAHDDKMIITRGENRSLVKAVYLDNEGHAIEYTVAVSEKLIVFLSEKRPETPVYRLTYRYIDSKTVYTSFEISKDGKKFTMYLEGKSRKVR
jgi:hypothetical protein